MRIRKRAPLIAVLILSLGGLLGGAWWWDDRDYPMPGIPEAPPTPFSPPAWDWSESLVTNLSRFQDRLRGNRYHRLKNKWIRELEFADTYWTFRSGKKCAIHFAGDGNLFVRMPEGSIPDKLESFHSYERMGVTEMALYPEENGKGEATEVRISAINENSIMLFGPGGAVQEVIDRSVDSSYFDSLGN